jgi:hypothetical protein
MNWIPVGLQAFNAIISLLEGAGALALTAGSPITALVAVISASFAQLKSDIIAYQAINPPPASALAKIEATLGIIVTNFQSFLASLNVNDSKLAALVVGLAQIILSTIAGFQSQLTPGVTVVGSSARLGAGVFKITPEKRSIRSFKHDWNALVVANGHSEISL